MKLIAIFVTLLIGISAFGAGLVINGSEIGVGKFHRFDNKIHKYGSANVWSVDILPEGGVQTPIVYPNPDGSMTIQFSNLEEFLRSAIQVAQQRGTKISVLNFHGHGMPGGMWYPKDAAQLASPECASWRVAAAAEDKSNYDQYYSPIPKAEILALRAASQKPSHFECVTGLPEFQEVVARIPNIKSYFSDDAQVHFLSCLVGLGPVGETFTSGVANLLLGGNRSAAKSILTFGLGDWSMPQGMGFWDYQNDAQLEHDNTVYPKDRQDREIAQKGTIRVASLVNGQWATTLVADQDFLLVGFPGFANSPARIFRGSSANVETVMLPMPGALRLPGTKTIIRRMR